MNEKPEKRMPPRGEIATIHLITNAKTGAFIVNTGDTLEVVEKLSGFKLTKADGRAYYIPFTSVAFIRFEKREEPADEEPETPEEPNEEPVNNGGGAPQR